MLHCCQTKDGRSKKSIGDHSLLIWFAKSQILGYMPFSLCFFIRNGLFQVKEIFKMTKSFFTQLLQQFKAKDLFYDTL